MKLQISKTPFDKLNLEELKLLYNNCKWDWLEPDQAMASALKESFRLYTVRSEKNLIGFARLISDGKIYGLLVDLMVDPQFRRQGVAKQMVDFVIEQCRQDELKILQLLASKAGTSLSQRAGFAKCPEDSPGMVKFLTVTG